MEMSDILSVIAIIISVVSAIFQWKRESHFNKVNLEADYFKELYKEHLLKNLPKKRLLLHFKNGILCDMDGLLDELNSIRQNSLYFYYVDAKFYMELKNVLQDLEDYLIECGNQVISDKENQEIVFQEIQEKLKKLYDVLMKRYYGV